MDALTDIELALRRQRDFYEKELQEKSAKIQELTKSLSILSGRLVHMEVISKKLTRYAADNERLEAEVYDLTMELKELTSYMEDDEE